MPFVRDTFVGISPNVSALLVTAFLRIPPWLQLESHPLLPYKGEVHGIDNSTIQSSQYPLAETALRVMERFWKTRPQACAEIHLTEESDVTRCWLSTADINGCAVFKLPDDFNYSHSQIMLRGRYHYDQPKRYMLTP